jgi:hypothetical protein
MIKTKDDKIDNLEDRILELSPVFPIFESKSTNTPVILFSTTATQSECNSSSSNISKATTSTNNKSIDKCTHSGCFLRQPRTPPTNFPSSKYSYTPPPYNIRLLPFSVDTYQDFRKLHIGHECEECAAGSLFYNYLDPVEEQVDLK